MLFEKKKRRKAHRIINEGIKNMMYWTQANLTVSMTPGLYLMACLAGTAILSFSVVEWLDPRG